MCCACPSQTKTASLSVRKIGMSSASAYCCMYHVRTILSQHLHSCAVDNCTAMEMLAQYCVCMYMSKRWYVKHYGVWSDALLNFTVHWMCDILLSMFLLFFFPCPFTLHTMPPSLSFVVAGVAKLTNKIGGLPFDQSDMESFQVIAQIV